MERTLTRSGSRRLAKRGPLVLNPKSSIAIKRDVHEFDVEAAAERFVEALKSLLVGPDSTFGLIRVKRPGPRMGRDFEVGERFQGCFSIERALLNPLDGRADGSLGMGLERLLGTRPAVWLMRWLEDHLLSDYAEIDCIELDPDVENGEVYRLRYGYLEGTPIAGSSTFTVEPLGPSRCRVTQIFEYQEVNGVALGTFQRFGLKFHDQVVHEQVRQAAERAGAQRMTGTIPAEYANL